MFAETQASRLASWPVIVSARVMLVQFTLFLSLSLSSSISHPLDGSGEKYCTRTSTWTLSHKSSHSIGPVSTCCLRSDYLRTFSTVEARPCVAPDLIQICSLMLKFKKAPNEFNPLCPFKVACKYMKSKRNANPLCT